MVNGIIYVFKAVDSLLSMFPFKDRWILASLVKWHLFLLDFGFALELQHSA